jgi:hypothetical protein
MDLLDQIAQGAFFIIREDSWAIEPRGFAHCR